MGREVKESTMTMNAAGLPATTARTNLFRIRVLVIMGVSGCGKTEVGRAVAQQWGADFQDADDWHTAEAVAKMAAGHALTDEDRGPWLERLRQKVIAATPAQGKTVLACSALRRRYRETLRNGQDGVQFIFLEGTLDLIASRMAARKGHFMPTTLLDSQFAALEAPGSDEAITISIDQPLEGVVADVLNVVVRA
jgi:gluconokinase